MQGLARWTFALHLLDLDEVGVIVTHVNMQVLIFVKICAPKSIQIRIQISMVPYIRVPCFYWVLLAIEGGFLCTVACNLWTLYAFVHGYFKFRL